MILDDEIMHLFFRIISFHDRVVNVWSVKPIDKGTTLLQTQTLHNILSRGLISSGGQGNSGNLFKPLSKERKCSVIWSEIVSPLGDTMGLINGKQGNLYFI